MLMPTSLLSVGFGVYCVVWRTANTCGAYLGPDTVLPKSQMCQGFRSLLPVMGWHGSPVDPRVWGQDRTPLWVIYLSILVALEAWLQTVHCSGLVLPVLSKKHCE